MADVAQKNQYAGTRVANKTYSARFLEPKGDYDLALNLERDARFERRATVVP